MKGKGTAALVLALMGGKKKPGMGEDGEEDMAPESSEEGGNEAGLAAAGELKDALKSGDEQAIYDAFKAMMDCCGDD